MYNVHRESEREKEGKEGDEGEVVEGEWIREKGRETKEGGEGVRGPGSI